MSRRRAKKTPKKIRGSFCERTEAPRSAIDRRSLRWVKSGTAWILVGCPIGAWMPRAGRCKVGTRAHKVLSPSPSGERCPVGGRRVTKR